MSVRRLKRGSTRSSSPVIKAHRQIKRAAKRADLQHEPGDFEFVTDSMQQYWELRMRSSPVCAVEISRLARAGAISIPEQTLLTRGGIEAAVVHEMTSSNFLHQAWLPRQIQAF